MQSKDAAISEKTKTLPEGEQFVFLDIHWIMPKKRTSGVPVRHTLHMHSTNDCRPCKRIYLEY